MDSRIVVVTGASRGIGRAIALDLSGHGYTSYLVGRDRDALNATKESIDIQGGSAFVIVADLSTTEGVAGCTKEIISHAGGQLYGIVNNAGVNRRGSVVRVTAADYDYIMNTNLRSVVLLTGALVPEMMPGGSIINVASLNSFDVMKGAGLYALSKAALVQYTRALAMEVGVDGIRVNAIAPGFIETDINRSLWQDEELRDWVYANTPLGRLGRTDDLLGTVKFLLGEDSLFITGSTIRVDGGFLRSRVWPIDL
jgi:NAD(P)-dependent dehydrogenase (short-subunit alcohol dehydrogenase family)